MTPADATASLQRLIGNRLELSALGEKRIACVIGDAPSRYSKSPALWNAAFDYLGVNAAYFPFDVTTDKLPALVETVRKCERFLGGNVTVPHKIPIMTLLDRVDEDARRIGAVNTIVRTPDGALAGYNTDGKGFVESLRMTLPDQSEAFLPSSMKGMDVLLLGAGGSARAVAFHLADHLRDGRLFLCNRTPEQAKSLADQLRAQGCNALVIDEAEIGQWAPRVGLLVNSTTKGQGGLRRMPDGRVITLEPYSSLAPAHPVPIAEEDFDEPGARQRWLDIQQKDVDANNAASLNLVRQVPREVRFYDLIYHPEESVFLRHGRLTRHRTRNGKAMIVCQAVIALCAHVCRQHLAETGKDNPATAEAVCNVMFARW